MGIGTGRIALPLTARGWRCTASTSPPMVGQLRAKPGGRDIPVALGDFRTAEVTGGPYALVYVVNGAFAELPTQDAQVDCFARAARLLRPGGLFVLDAHVPEALAQGARPGASCCPPAAVRPSCDSARWTGPSSVTAPTTSSSGAAGGRRGDAPHDGVLPLRRRVRAGSDGPARGAAPARPLGGLDGLPFTSASAFHVSVYERPA
ncbi:methyltransferase domain-containing protein [Streptomyces stramineus]